MNLHNSIFQDAFQSSLIQAQMPHRSHLSFFAEATFASQALGGEKGPGIGSLLPDCSGIWWPSLTSDHGKSVLLPWEKCTNLLEMPAEWPSFTREVLRKCRRPSARKYQCYTNNVIIVRKATLVSRWEWARALLFHRNIVLAQSFLIAHRFRVGVFTHSLKFSCTSKTNAGGTFLFTDLCKSQSPNKHSPGWGPARQHPAPWFRLSHSTQVFFSQCHVLHFLCFWSANSLLKMPPQSVCQSTVECSVVQKGYAVPYRESTRVKQASLGRELWCRWPWSQC